MGAAGIGKPTSDWDCERESEWRCIDRRCDKELEGCGAAGMDESENRFFVRSRGAAGADADALFVIVGSPSSSSSRGGGWVSTSEGISRQTAWNPPLTKATSRAYPSLRNLRSRPKILLPSASTALSAS